MQARSSMWRPSAPTAGLSPQSITRWRFTRRSAVFRQARFQLLHVLFELFYLFSQRQQFGYQGFEHVIFFSDGLQLFPKGLQFFFWLHRFPLAGFSHFGKSSAELSSYSFSYISSFIYTFALFPTTFLDRHEKLYLSYLLK